MRSSTLTATQPQAASRCRPTGLARRASVIPRPSSAVPNPNINPNPRRASSAPAASPAPSGPAAEDEVDDELSQKIADWIRQLFAKVFDPPQYFAVYYREKNGKGPETATYLDRTQLVGKSAEELLSHVKEHVEYDPSTPITVRAFFADPPKRSMPDCDVVSDRWTQHWSDVIEHAVQNALWWEISVISEEPPGLFRKYF